MFIESPGKFVKQWVPGSLARSIGSESLNSETGKYASEIRPHVILMQVMRELH